MRRLLTSLRRDQRGSQMVEWLALALLSLTLIGMLIQALKSHTTLQSKVRGAVERVFDQIGN